MKKLFVCAAILAVFIGCSSYKPKTTFDTSNDFYNYARYFFTKHETRLFKKLKSAEDRDKFIADFWDARESADDTGPTFKETILERYEHASRYLREANIPGWKTERGRIFLLLGEPSEIIKNDVNTLDLKSEILWYYSANPSAASYSGMYIRFTDTRGHGTYQMDHFNSSLRLLDRIEDARFQVLNKDKQPDSPSSMKFSANLDNTQENLLLKIEPESVSFDKKNDDVSVQIEIKILFYQGKLINKHRKTYKLNYKENDFLEKAEKIEIKIPLNLNPGKTQADIFITDLNSSKTFRKVVTLKKRKIN